jgi:membrane protein implicated in regulation of membrane protease activity
MSIGGGIALIVIGAILAFAVNVDVPGLNLYAIGLICIVAGAVGLVLGLALTYRRTAARRLRSTETIEHQRTPTGEATIRRTDGDVL